MSTPHEQHLARDDVFAQRLLKERDAAEARVAELEAGERWTVSICSLHNVPLFQEHRGCTCKIEDTVMARSVEVAALSPPESIAPSAWALCDRCGRISHDGPCLSPPEDERCGLHLEQGKVCMKPYGHDGSCSPLKDKP